jgi:DNA invertase Pin-like site-specific DNA recombinase
VTVGSWLPPMVRWTTSTVGRCQVTVLAAVAEMERGFISDRTKVALAAKKARGARLGRPVTLGSNTRNLVVALRAAGLSLPVIATQLNSEGVATARGGKWHPSNVAAVLASVELDEAAASIASAA